MKKHLIAALLAGLVTVGVSAVGLTEHMEIGVRSGIDKAEKKKRDQDASYAQDPSKRLRRYLLASVKEVKTGENLVKPVNARAIAAQLNQVLQQQGFRPVGREEEPEIIVTALYGRGMIINPYIDPDTLPVTDWRKGRRGPSNISDSVPVTPVLDHKSYVGLRDKTAALNYEKLAIQVSAWKYPPPADPKLKPEELWVTTMYADDADHRDLNEISEKLLETAAPYFDKHIDREKEVKVWAPLPEGRVKVGTPEVVPETQK